MKKLILGALLCTISHSNFAMMLQLPDASTLRNRLYCDDATFPQLDEQKQYAIIDLLSGEKQFAELRGLLSIAANWYPPTRETSVSLQRQELLAKALLKDYPDELQNILSVINLAKAPQKADPNSLEAHLHKHGLHNYTKSLGTNLSSLTSDINALNGQELTEKLKQIFNNYYKYLVIMKIECSKDTLEQHNKLFTELLLQSAFPNTKVNVAIK